jgi:DivIVA domain-containing protein
VGVSPTHTQGRPATTPTARIILTETTGSAPADVRSGGLQGDHFSRYVRRTFRRTLRGYSTADVDEHLRQVRGWFTLAGFDELLADRRDEILGSALAEAETTVEHARREAETTVEHAQREAETTVEHAQREAEATVEQARREAETILDEATRCGEATTAAAEQRLASLKTLALAILQETDAQS